MIARLDQVSKSYPRPEGGEPSQVLRHVDFTLAPGEVVAVVGPSGSGKTTLLNLIGCLDRPDSGRVTVDGRDVATLSDDERASLRATTLGFVFQQHRLLPQCSAWENVLVPTLAPGADVAGATDRAAALLTAVGLEDRLAHRPGQLSVGQCQRVALARALVNQPSLLLADEPTGALDPATADEMLELLLSLRADRGVAMLLVTHSDAVAARADRVLVLDGGGLTAR